MKKKQVVILIFLMSSILNNYVSDASFNSDSSMELDLSSDFIINRGINFSNIELKISGDLIINTDEFVTFDNATLKVVGSIILKKGNNLFNNSFIQTESTYGFYLDQKSGNNLILSNIIINNNFPLFLNSSSNNIIRNNEIKKGTIGVYIDGQSDFNLIKNNEISGSSYAVFKHGIGINNSLVRNRYLGLVTGYPFINFRDYDFQDPRYIVNSTFFINKSENVDIAYLKANNSKTLTNLIINNVTFVEVGKYNISLVGIDNLNNQIYQNYSFLIVTEFISPEIVKYPEKYYSFNSTQSFLSWRVKDPNPGYYTIEINGTLFKESTWTNENEITLNITGLEVATYELVISIFDIYENVNMSKSFVYVLIEHGDFDKDGISNLLEDEIGSLPYKTDSDEDGIPDLYEFNNNLMIDMNDSLLDLDNDGLTNIAEWRIGTFANNSDSDNDGMPDKWEVDFKLDPLSPADATKDPDNDGLINQDEFTNQTDPKKADTDNDGDLDGFEVSWGFDPNDPKSNFKRLSNIFLLIVGGIIFFVMIALISRELNIQDIIKNNKSLREIFQEIDASNRGFVNSENYKLAKNSGFKYKETLDLFHANGYETSEEFLQNLNLLKEKLIHYNEKFSNLKNLNQEDLKLEFDSVILIKFEYNKLEKMINIVNEQFDKFPENPIPEDRIEFQNNFRELHMEMQKLEKSLLKIL